MRLAKKEQLREVHETKRLLRKELEKWKAEHDVKTKEMLEERNLLKKELEVARARQQQDVSLVSTALTTLLTHLFLIQYRSD